MNEIVAKSTYDVAVIGAGIAGLTAAALLSKAGLSVCVLEKQPQVGGYLAGFRRKNFRFDSAIHWLNQCGKNGMVTRIFEFIGDDYPKTKMLHRIHRDKGTAHDYTITSNPEELKAAWIKDFPAEKKGIEKFFRAAQKIAKAYEKIAANFRSAETMSLLEKTKTGISKLPFLMAVIRYIWYNGEDVPKGLSKHFFKDPRLQALYASEKDLLSCLFPIVFAYIDDYQLPPQGGSQTFIEWLQYVVSYFDNDIICSAPVRQIVYKDGAAEGLIFTKKGKDYTIKCGQIIAACDVETLYEKMLPPKAIPSQLKHNLKEAELYTSAVAISLALDCPTEALGFGEELLFISEEGISRAEHYASDPHITAISVIPPSLRDASLAPKGKGTLTIYTSADIHYKDNWGTEKDAAGNYIRTPLYYEIKEAYSQVILDRIEKRLGIDLRSHILLKEVATPVTHWRYTGNRGGSIMGARPGKANMQAKIAHHQTPVANLILGGHWSDLGGGVPIAVRAGANAALLVLRQQKPKAFKLFANYADGKLTVKEAKKSNSFLAYDNSWKQGKTPAQS